MDHVVDVVDGFPRVRDGGVVFFSRVDSSERFPWGDGVLLLDVARGSLLEGDSTE